MKIPKAPAGAAQQLASFAKDLRARIAEAQQSVPQVGALLNMRASTLQAYCSGRSRPNARNLQKLMQIFGADLARHFEGTPLVGPTTPALQIVPIDDSLTRFIVRIEVVASLEAARQLREVLERAGLLADRE